MNRFLFLALAVLMISTASCTKKTESANVVANPQALLVAKGKQAYLNYCIACHAPNPQKDGPLGPAVWESSLELLEARILTGTYPDGYTPKRTSKTMAPLPHAKEHIAALHAYLNSTEP